MESVTEFDNWNSFETPTSIVQCDAKLLCYRHRDVGPVIKNDDSGPVNTGQPEAWGPAEADYPLESKDDKSFLTKSKAVQKSPLAKT